MHKVFTDHIGKIISVPFPPQRIVSVVPSQTELLFDLGLEEQVVGITKFCEYPTQWHRSKTRIGGTKNLNIEKIRVLEPDLIIANKEENVQAQIEALEAFCPVWTSEVKTLTDALSMIEQVAELTDRQMEGKQICNNIQNGFETLHDAASSLPAAYLIWKDPYMTVGGDTFISDMMRYAGLENVFAYTQRYPSIDLQTLQNKCRVVVLSSEPYPFTEKHIEAIQSALPGIKVVLADGAMFSWYGSRLQHAASYFKGFREMLTEC